MWLFKDSPWRVIRLWHQYLFLSNAIVFNKKHDELISICLIYGLYCHCLSIKPKNSAMQHCQWPFERLHINSLEDIPCRCRIISLISIYTVCAICNNVANLNPGRLKTWIIWLFQGFPLRGIQLWYQFLLLSNAIGLICNYCTNKPN